MPETREELERQLHHFSEEKRRNEAAILETRKLLERVDKKRRENPTERHKWNLKLDSLEEVLAEKKRLYTASETHIVQLQRRLDTGDYFEPDAEPESPKAAASREPLLSEDTLPENLSIEDLKRAVQKVLSTHLVRLQTVSDLDYRMAKAFLGSRAAGRLTQDQLAELRKRIKLLDKTRGTVQRSMSRHDGESGVSDAPEESDSTRDAQSHLKSVLEKSAAGDLSTVTIGEIEVLAKYVKARVQADPEAAESKRLQTALDAIAKRIRGIGLT